MYGNMPAFAASFFQPSDKPQHIMYGNWRYQYQCNQIRCTINLNI